MPNMLLIGTANPPGQPESTYNGLWLKQEELADLVQNGSLRGVPVKTEHTGSNIGQVVSSFLDSSGALQLLMEIETSGVEGAITAGFVKDRIAGDLSLGYTVDLRNSDNHIRAGEKRVLEVSVVRKGAREKCHIHAFHEHGKEVEVMKPSTTWDSFDMT